MFHVTFLHTFIYEFGIALTFDEGKNIKVLWNVVMKLQWLSNIIGMLLLKAIRNSV